MPNKIPLPPVPVLRPGVIYSGDNGRRVCLKCAGSSALFTGRDLSGQKVQALPLSMNPGWFADFGKPLACEAGCTTYRNPEEN